MPGKETKKPETPAKKKKPVKPEGHEEIDLEDEDEAIFKDYWKQLQQETSR